MYEALWISQQVVGISAAQEKARRFRTAGPSVFDYRLNLLLLLRLRRLFCYVGLGRVS